MLFAVIHPILIFKAIDRQIMAKIEHEAPPHGIPIEDFIEVSIIDAAITIKTQKNPNIIWSENDQQRMSEGKMPKGTPLHPNS